MTSAAMLPTRPERGAETGSPDCEATGDAETGSARAVRPYSMICTSTM